MNKGKNYPESLTEHKHLTCSALYRAVNALKLAGMLEGDSKESWSLLIFMLVAT